MVPRFEIVASTSKVEVVFRVALFTLTFSTDSTSAVSGAAPAKGQKVPNNQDALYARTTFEQPETWGRLRWIASLGPARRQGRRDLRREPLILPGSVQFS